ncbi:uncharacterized protein LOC128951613 [Oppia nitens]|uniref:uncharacterized protein LOC128951613 n=1 Tax=Oppia nitens TaxID=1686743 RepID=UPI0023DAE8A4|nr:uncharacterized protein LOC128951613 [Oppia nitens]
MNSNKIKNEINILLLGETGVGKTTFINAFANYLNSDSLEQAVNSRPLCLIPTQFVITDADYQLRNVSYGDDNNENFDSPGQSTTQQCRAYCFRYENDDHQILVRLIDTPGVGDTRGTDQDKYNLDHVLQFISQYEWLHLICILMKPDMVRLTETFQYCLKQLLSYLQKDASNNMVFVFTNTRPTFYRPKNTPALLKQVLDELETQTPGVRIPLDKQTMYCVDNDSFQYLIAVRDGVEFEADLLDNYELSWQRSVDECKRLLNYVTVGQSRKPLPPHRIQNTLSINETRRLILALSEPLVKVSDDICDYLNELNQLRAQVADCQEDIDNILTKLRHVDRQEPTGFFGRLFGSKNRADKEKDKLLELLSETTDSQKTKENSIIHIDCLIHVLKQEEDTIMQSMAKFALFLKRNAITVWNDSCDDYISKQKSIVQTSSKSMETIRQELDKWQAIYERYGMERKLLEKAIDLGELEGIEISVENVANLIPALYELKYTGDEIREQHRKYMAHNELAIKRELIYVIEPNESRSFFMAIKF